VGNTPEWINVDYKFKDLDIHWTSVPPNVKGAEKQGIGAYFEGENGTLLCDYSNRTITINGEEMKDIDSVPVTILRSRGHQQNFV
ncbi:MAG: gfo/Idh/MocA family oxidoreductase, partial [Spirosomaceae bacterium]|nr:gfo/Idh/MocA family oxidoreductase [Spirosomataceae bacterium]